MTKSEKLRAYIGEPLLAGFSLSLLINAYSADANAAFMHAESRDVLSLILVFLGASIALWAGLFFISASEFGRWLALKGVAEDINAAYVTTTCVFLIESFLCILCAYVSERHVKLQLVAEFFGLWSLTAVIPMLNNTKNLLKLQYVYRNQPKVVTELRA